MLGVPFPARTGRYDVRAGLRRLATAGPEDGGTARFLFGERALEVLARKLQLLEAHDGEVRLVQPHRAPGDVAALEHVLRTALGWLAEEHPERCRVTRDAIWLPLVGLALRGDAVVRAGPPAPALGPLGPAVEAWLTRRHGLALLADALALSIMDDYAVVHRPAAAEGDAAPLDALELLHVCFPSSWDPRAKVGLPFSAVHAPVANAAPLLATAPAMVEAMVAKGPFVRFVWGIARDPHLPHHPRLSPQAPAVARIADDPDRAARHAWFRVERQVTHPFPAVHRSLFTIRTWVVPLAEVAADPGRAAALARALASMDDAALAYKGLTTLRDPLVRWLTSRAGGS